MNNYLLFASHSSLQCGGYDDF